MLFQICRYFLSRFVTLQNSMSRLTLQYVETHFPPIIISMAEYQRGGQLSEDDRLSFSSSSQEKEQRKYIRGTKFILRYSVYLGVDFDQLQKSFQDDFNDLNLKILKTSWTNNSQMFLLILSKRKKLSLRRWTQVLSRNESRPRLMSFESKLHTALMTQYDHHYPEKYTTKLKKLMTKVISIEEFAQQNIEQLKNLTKLNQNIEFYENKKLEGQLKALKYAKYRGVWLFGQANSGKTTMAIKYLEGETVYFKDMTTQTFDHYKGQSSIFLDQMNIDNSRKLLPILKNLVNCIPGRFNVKFGTRMIYPKNVVVTTQYPLNVLTKDLELMMAIKERFYFYHVQRLEDYTIARSYKDSPNDTQAYEEFVYNQELGQIASSLDYYKLQVAQIDEISWVNQAQFQE